MPKPARVLIVGGYGVFGRLAARMLLDETDADLIIAGRDGRKAERTCKLLSRRRATPLKLDLHDRPAFNNAASGCLAVACLAGPFQRLDRGLALAAVKAGAHWLDVSDAREWVVPMLADASLHEAGVQAGASIIPGLSTTPALSGALARWSQQRLAGVRRARITLYIGNRNAKGAAAIASALESGFRDPATVSLPMGRRRAYRFESPDKALFSKEGIAAEFRVGFEWGLSNALLRAAQPLGKILNGSGRLRLAGLLSAAASPFSRFGSDAACLQVETETEKGEGFVASLTGGGQRMAVLPLVLCLKALLCGELPARGCLPPSSCLSPDQWAEKLRATGLILEGRNARLTV